jgi:hypothetical protein
MYAQVYRVPAGGQLGVGDDERVVGEVHGMTGTTLNACSDKINQDEKRQTMQAPPGRLTTTGYQ